MVLDFAKTQKVSRRSTRQERSHGTIFRRIERPVTSARQEEGGGGSHHPPPWKALLESSRERALLEPSWAAAQAPLLLRCQLQQSPPLVLPCGSASRRPMTVEQCSV